GHGHVDQNALVAAPEALEDRQAAPSQHADLARLRARLEGQLRLAFERRDGQRGAERRLGDREVDGRVDVVALAHEARVRPDVDLDVDVARPATDRAGVALAADADALAVVDAGRDLQLARALLDHTAGADAFLA